MRIVSTSPVTTKFLLEFGLGPVLVGASHACQLPEELSQLPRVTRAPTGDSPFSDYELDYAAIEALAPSHLCAFLTSDPARLEVGYESEVQRLRDRLYSPELRVFSVRPVTLEEVYASLESLGEFVGRKSEGVQFKQKLRAQFMNWADAFYDRMKNRRVTVISSLDPLEVAGDWVPDLITLASAISHAPRGTVRSVPTTWDKVVEFKPDVIVVAPRGKEMKEVLSTFKQLEKLPRWDEIVAVRRGDVFFCDGVTRFYDLKHSIIESVAVLFSCIAGLDSGYITPRDSFYRLRWLELQRHRI